MAAHSRSVIFEPGGGCRWNLLGKALDADAARVEGRLAAEAGGVAGGQGAAGAQGAQGGGAGAQRLLFMEDFEADVGRTGLERLQTLVYGPTDAESNKRLQQGSAQSGEEVQGDRRGDEGEGGGGGGYPDDGNGHGELGRESARERERAQGHGGHGGAEEEGRMRMDHHHHQELFAFLEHLHKMRLNANRRVDLIVRLAGSGGRGPGGQRAYLLRLLAKSRDAEVAVACSTPSEIANRGRNAAHVRRLQAQLLLGLTAEIRACYGVVASANASLQPPPLRAASGGQQRWSGAWGVVLTAEQPAAPARGSRTTAAPEVLDGHPLAQRVTRVCAGLGRSANAAYGWSSNRAVEASEREVERGAEAMRRLLRDVRAIVHNPLAAAYRESIESVSRAHRVSIIASEEKLHGAQHEGPYLFPSAEEIEQLVPPLPPPPSEAAGRFARAESRRVASKSSRRLRWGATPAEPPQQPLCDSFAGALEAAFRSAAALTVALLGEAAAPEHGGGSMARLSSGSCTEEAKRLGAALNAGALRARCAQAQVAVSVPQGAGEEAEGSLTDGLRALQALHALVQACIGPKRPAAGKLKGAEDERAVARALLATLAEGMLVAASARVKLEAWRASEATECGDVAQEEAVSPEAVEVARASLECIGPAATAIMLGSAAAAAAAAAMTPKGEHTRSPRGSLILAHALEACNASPDEQAPPRI